MDAKQTYLLITLLFAILGYLIKRLIDGYDKKHIDFEDKIKKLETNIFESTTELKKSVNSHIKELYNSKIFMQEYSKERREEEKDFNEEIKKLKSEIVNTSESFFFKLKGLDFSLKKVIETTNENKSVLSTLQGKILTFEKKEKENTKSLVEYRKILKKHNELISEHLVKNKKTGDKK